MSEEEEKRKEEHRVALLIPDVEQARHGDTDGPGIRGALRPEQRCEEEAWGVRRRRRRRVPVAMGGWRCATARAVLWVRRQTHRQATDRSV